MKTKLLSASDDDIRYAGEILRRGGLVGMPTETVYGLAGNALCGDCVRKIYQAKGRPSDNPLIVHISSLSQWEPLVTEIPEKAKKLAEKFWPGPRRYLRHYGRELDAVADLPGAVREEAARGDGWVKVVADWIDRDLGADGDLRPLWPDDVLAEAVAAAHDAGARVTAHTFSTEALDPLLDAGVDCLEHATGATPAQVERIAAAGVPVTPTLLQVERFDAIAAQGEARFPRFAARMRAMHARREQHVRDLHDAGVRLLVGTDAGGTIGHGRVADEAAAMVGAGVPVRDVVAAASWRTRAWLGVDGIGEGTSADVVVYDRDPRADVTALAEPTAVVLRGTRVG